MKKTIGSSIICMDHINFERDVKFAEELGVDYLHIDIMDGNFVPRYGIYPEILKRMSEITEMKMDLHIMTDDPEFTINQFKGIDNVEFIFFHFEGNERNALRIIDNIKRDGKKPGIAINLSTPVSAISELIKSNELYGIMFMGIHPGVLIQSHRPDFINRKCEEFKMLLETENNIELIQCDGGVTFDTIESLANSGINNFVCGSSTLYKNVNRTLNWNDNSTIIKNNFARIREMLDEL